MAESESAKTARPAVPAAFILRRLHSLSGIVPIGAFLVIHLLTNSSIVWGELGKGGVATFQHEVDFIHSTPFLLIIEVFGLWLPIGFHALLGFYYAFTGSSNVRHYGWGANWRYTLQRLTGYVGFVFILYHVATLRWGWMWLPFSSAFDAEMAASTTARALQGGADSTAVAGLAVGALYLAGVLCLVFHLANGLWTAAITWGLTRSAGSMRRWGYVCTAFGLGLGTLGVMAFVGFVTLDVEKTRAEEAQRRSQIVSGDTPAVGAVAGRDQSTSTTDTTDQP